MLRKGPHLKNRRRMGSRGNYLKVLRQLNKQRNKMCKKFSELCVLGFVKFTENSFSFEYVRAVHFYN